MSVLLITCPNIGREFSTGIQVTWKRSLARVPRDLTHTHRWLPRGEWIENQNER
jgi:hypothetical protein